MCKMGHVIGCAASYSQSQLQNHVSYNKPLCLDGERERYYEQLVIGECHSVTKQDSVYCSRCTNGKYPVQILHHRNGNAVANLSKRIIGIDQLIMDKLANLLHQSGTYSAQQVEQQESF